MNIKIITLNKVSERFTKEAIKEYDKRLSKYCKLSLKECKNTAQVFKELNDKSYVVHIHTMGNLVSSEDLAEKFSSLGLSGQSDIAFLVSEDPLPEEVRKRVNFELAVSRMDIEFSVLLVILYEQIYRAFRINCGEPYHK